MYERLSGGRKCDGEVGPRLPGPQNWKVNGIRGRLASLEQHQPAQFINSRCFLRCGCVSGGVSAEVFSVCQGDCCPLLLLRILRHLLSGSYHQLGRLRQSWLLWADTPGSGQSTGWESGGWGGGDRKRAPGFRVKGLIDWPSPVRLLLCLSICCVELTELSE